MTTFTYTGISVFDDGAGPMFEAIDLVVVVPFTTSVLEYRYLMPGETGYDAGSAAVIFTQDPTFATLSGDPLETTAVGGTVQLQILTITWDGGTKTADVAYAEDTVTGDFALFRFGGDAIGPFTMVSEVEAFLLSLDSFGPIVSGPFAPNTPFLLSSLANLTSTTEDDTVLGYSGIDMFSVGSGDDTVAGLAGDDVLDGGDDFDNLRYDFDVVFGGAGGILALSFGGALNVTDGFGDLDTATNFESIRGTFNVDTVSMDGSLSYFRFQGLGSADSYTGHANTEDELDYRKDADNGGTSGINARLDIGQVTDGFGNTDTVSSIDRIRGTESSDFITADDTGIRMRGEGGGDFLIGGDGDDIFDGGDGIDTASFENADVGVKVDLRFSGKQTNVGKDDLIEIENLTGSNFDDRLTGDANNNTIRGLDGADIIRGKGGNDTFFGGNGDDNIKGGDDTDFINGDDDSDTLFGLSGDDFLYGGDGEDFLYGGRDSDHLEGGDGVDRLRGNKGADDLFGDGGNDNLRGGGGGDLLDGGADDDFMYGEAGTDRLVGGLGDDNLFGGDGTTMDGTRDTFVYAEAGNSFGGFDKIRDWEDGIDVIDVAFYEFTAFSEVAALASDRATGMRIEFGAGEVLFIDGFFKADFDETDVVGLLNF
jgi:Ca2+-binding RTX toxin-like protein